MLHLQDGEAQVGLESTHTSRRPRKQLQKPEETDPDAYPPDTNVNHVRQYDYRAVLGSGSARSENTITSSKPTPVAGQLTNVMLNGLPFPSAIEHFIHRTSMMSIRRISSYSVKLALASRLS